MKKLITVLAVLGMVFVLAPAAAGGGFGVISVNMDRWAADPLFFDQNVDQMATTEVAGLVPSAYWNAYDPAAGSWQGGTPVDDSGVAVGGGFTVTGSGGNDSWNTGGTNNQKMFGDFSGGGSKIISNIPYALYDIIVYSKLYNDATQSFDIDGGTAQTVRNYFPGRIPNEYENPQSFDLPTWSNGVFADGVHYTTFTGLTASSVTLNHDAMAGFQIVASIPLPPAGTLIFVQ